MIHAGLFFDGHVIGGECDSSLPKDTIRSPWHGGVAGVAAEGNRGLLESMFDSARGCDLAAVSPHDRRAALLAVAEDLERYADEWAEGLVEELAKPIVWARAEVARCAVTFRLAADLVVDFSVEAPVDQGTDRREGYRLGVRRRPVGVVYGIVPWNWPLNLAAHKLAPAIAAGCPIVMKASPVAPLATLRLCALLGRALPPGAVSAWNGPTSELGDTVKLADFLSFTGSAKIGWALRREVPDVPAILELGAASAVIVDRGSDIARAVERVVWGGFGFAGQVCISVQHVLVHRSLMDEFRDRLLAGLPAVGDPSDDPTLLSAMISTPEASLRWDKVREACEMGATLLAGASPFGNRLGPVVLENVGGTVLDRDEIFGPVVCLEAFDDLPSALARENGRGGSIQTGYFGEDPESFLSGIRTGGAVLDDVPTVRFDALPYGGLGQSGLGREGPTEAVTAMTRPLSVIRR